MNKIDEENKEKEIDMIYQTVLEAIPVDVFMENIAIALNRLAAEFIWQMSENDDGDDDNAGEDILLNGSGFSKN